MVTPPKKVKYKKGEPKSEPPEPVTVDITDARVDENGKVFTDAMIDAALNNPEVQLLNTPLRDKTAPKQLTYGEFGPFLMRFMLAGGRFAIVSIDGKPDYRSINVWLGINIKKETTFNLVSLQNQTSVDRALTLAALIVKVIDETAFMDINAPVKPQVARPTAGGTTTVTNGMRTVNRSNVMRDIYLAHDRVALADNPYRLNKIN